MSSLLVDDILDDAHWTNVQDPVRQMFSSLTKAIRTQSVGVRDLDRKIGYLISKEQVDHLMSNLEMRCCNKEDATDIMKHVDSKASHEVVAGIDAKLSKVNLRLMLLLALYIPTYLHNLCRLRSTWQSLAKFYKSNLIRFTTLPSVLIGPALTSKNSRSPTTTKSLDTLIARLLSL